MNIAIWGMGVSGKAALDIALQSENQVYCVSQGDPNQWCKELPIAPELCFDQENIPSGLNFDLIIMSPGIDPRQDFLERFKNVPRICEVEWAFQLLHQKGGETPPIVAITGTNGKTTTCTLIAEALKLAGKSVFLGGNIGRPFCTILNSEKHFDYIVLELSSFQLELMDQFRADITGILNIEPNHMERYDSFEDYQRAKLNINKNPPKLFLSTLEYKDQPKFQEIKAVQNIDWSGSVLKGEHYLKNFFVVEEVLKFFNEKNCLQELANTFKGVSYRLEYKGDKDGVKIYNDGKSTNTAATFNAIKSFPKQSITLVMGGKMRSARQDLSMLMGLKQVEKVIAFGESAPEVAKQFQGICKVEIINRLEELNLSQVKTDVLLFSPAYPSFDHYKNYLERAEHFNQVILGK